MSRQHRNRLSLQTLEDRSVPAGMVSLSESTFLLEQFRTNLVSAIEGNVVGYAIGLREHSENFPLQNFENDNIAGGEARTSDDTPPGEGGLNMETWMRMETASVSKPITATAILHLLQTEFAESSNLAADIDEALNRKMVDYLPEDWNVEVDPKDLDDPANWNKGFIPQITIRDLLQHRSGLDKNHYTYEDVRNRVEAGIDGVWQDPDGYSSTNYSLLRVMLPYLWSEVDNRILDGELPNDQLPDYLKNHLVSDYPGASVNSLSPGQVTASLYKYYVRTFVLGPAGIANADTRTSGENSVLVFPYAGN